MPQPLKRHLISTTSIIIIGGLSAGPSAAAKARRNQDANILLFEKTAHISHATCGIPYALSGTIPSRGQLMGVQPDQLVRRFGIELHLGGGFTAWNRMKQKRTALEVE